MNEYLKMKDRHEKEFSEFPMVFAFSKKQFKEGMNKLGLEPTDTDKVYKSIGGGFYKKIDEKRLTDLLDRHSKEIDNAIKADKIGDGFIYDMFNYELGNHEYCYTLDATDTLNALGLPLKEIRRSESLTNGLTQATITQCSESW